MRIIFFNLVLFILVQHGYSQQTVITLTEGQTNISAALVPPVRNLIAAADITLTLSGKWSSSRKDTGIVLVLNDRTRSNRVSLVDSIIMISEADWPADGKEKILPVTVYIRHAAVQSQKKVEYADLYQQSQPEKMHTLQFDTLETLNTTPKTPATTSAQSKTSPDTLTYLKPFGYKNDSILYDLKLKKYGDYTEMRVCSNKTEIADAVCSKKVLLGVIGSEKFQVVLAELMQANLPRQDSATYKISPTVAELYAGYTNFVEKSTPIEETAIQKQLKESTARLNELFSEKADEQSIGIFRLTDSVVNIHLDSNLIPAKIVSVEIVLANGSIRKNGLKVELTNGQVYRNKKSPISLYRLDKRKDFRLLVDDNRTGKKGHYLEVGDVINYIYKGKFSYPGDGRETLSPTKQTDTLFVASTVSELLDVNIFSDLLALLGRRPNGIIQTQATATFITNTGNPWDNQDIVPHNFVKAYFRLSKYDSKFSQLDSTAFKNNNLDSLSRLYLHQVAFLQAGLKTNLFRIGIGNNQQVFINAGAEINLTNADSLFKKDLVSINYYPEIEYTISRLENFGLETSIRYLRQSVPKNSPFKNRAAVWIFNPQATIYYYPFANPNNKIYVRYAHFAQIRDGKYNYPQFQFGIKTNLFSKKEKTD